jgi:TrmH family RNA methyltransferase
MKLDDVKKLHQKKYRTQLGYYLIEGEHLILECYKAFQQGAIEVNSQPLFLYVTENHEVWAETLSAVFSVKIVSEKQMKAICDTKSPQGMVACVPLSQATVQHSTQSITQHATQSKMRYVYLHEVQDPGNLGTILRTLGWFGQLTLLLSPNSVDPYNAKVVRSSMGAIFHVPVELDVTFTDLTERFSTFAYLDMQGKPIQEPAFKTFACYLFGNEARGVPHSLLSTTEAQAFSIAGSGQIDSLNLGSAVSMSVYELTR